MNKPPGSGELAYYFRLHEGYCTRHESTISRHIMAVLCVTPHNTQRFTHTSNPHSLAKTLRADIIIFSCSFRRWACAPEHPLSLTFADANFNLLELHLFNYPRRDVPCYIQCSDGGARERRSGGSRRT